LNYAKHRKQELKGMRELFSGEQTRADALKTQIQAPYGQMNIKDDRCTESVKYGIVLHVIE
jgi:hypothetical protein